MSWPTIDATRYAAGSLLTSNLNLDLLERDWGALERVTDHAFVFPPLTSVFVTHSLWFGFPDTWALDDTFDPTMKLRIVMYLEGLAGGGSSFWEARFVSPALTQIDTAVGLNDTTSRTKMVGEFPTLPTGVTEVQFEARRDPFGIAPYSTLRRVFGQGVDTGIYFARGL